MSDALTIDVERDPLKPDCFMVVIREGHNIITIPARGLSRNAARQALPAVRYAFEAGTRWAASKVQHLIWTSLPPTITEPDPDLKKENDR